MAAESRRQRGSRPNSAAEAANLITYEVAPPEIGKYFGVMAQQKQKAMNTGRHPSSLPKNSELWHYSKLSTQRRDRIKKGHQFWDVIEQENVETTVPPVVPDNKEKEDEYTIKARELHFLKGSSVNQKLRKFLATSNSNDMQHLELRVDFKNKNQIYFGMSFIIMNYADEILYVNSKEELRCKPINLIEPGDRIKFKMIDLNNPSNPQPLCFGDTMYLQCLEASETAENNFSQGTVLTSKLFGLPQHSCLNFDVNHTYTTMDNYGHNTHAIKSDIGIFAEAENDLSAPDSPGELTPTASTQQMRRGSMMNMVKTPNSVTAPTTPGAGGKAGDLDALDAMAQQVETDGDGNEGSVGGESQAGKPPGTAGMEGGTNPAPHKTKHFTNAATICGDVHITRICEVRQLDNLGFQSDFGLLSDDKALRYTSKAASLLGKWSVHSAELESSPTKDKAKSYHTYGAAKDTQSMHAIKENAGLQGVKDNRVYSVSPIFIQQDLYCISTKTHAEHTTWPMRSTAIINTSKNINKDTALEYRTAYRESAVVKNALQQRQYNKGTTRLFDLDETIDHTDTHPHRDHTLDDAITSGASGASNGAGNAAGTPYAYGCLRKVVKRGPPYDFSVDRRCVWKFCLFEQFSDNNIKLSVKDRAAKKVMETATMAMKLSQLNREGAHTHIQTHTYGEDLPPLKSGETFVRTLREINFKTTIKLEESYLAMRRAKEARLKQHFADHMKDLRVMEKVDQMESEKKNKSRSMKSLSGLSIATGNDSIFSDTNSGVGTFDESWSARSPGGRNRARGSSAGGGSSTGSPSSAVSPKAKALMNKPTGARQTAFLVDSLPPHLKPGRDKSKANLSQASLQTNSTASNSPTHFPNVSMLSPSARIAAYASSEMFGPSTNSVRFAHDDVSVTSSTGTGAGAANTHSNGAAGSALSPNFAGLKAHTSTRNVVGTTAARGRNSVTFTTEKIFIPGAMTEQTMVNSLAPEVTLAAQLAAKSVAALPDFDPKVKDREAELHLNPKRLLLDNPKSLHMFDHLSAGEQVLAMHKTFHHIGGMVLDPNRPRRHLTNTNKSSANAVAAKLNRLLEEDKNIKQVLHYKERRENMRSKDELYEHSSGV